MSDAAALRAVAVDALGALRRHCFAPEHDLYGRRRLGGFAYATLWSHVTAWAASLAVGALEPALLAPPGSACAAVRRYRAGTRSPAPGGLDSAVVPPLGRGGDRYYDDNAWIGLAALRHAELVPDAELVALADEVAAFVETGWSTDPAFAVPGGIHWRETPRRGRNTCANAPAAALFAKLARRGRGDATGFAIAIYRWTRAALRTEGGLYVDHIAPDGRRDPTLWSYNQGAMIGAGVVLAELTGEETYRTDAAETLAAALARYATPERLIAEPAAFVAVFFRNAFLLAGTGADAPAGDLARAFVRALAARRARTGLVAGRDALMATAALAEVAALLAGAPPGP